jgi:hypothetical protein
MLGGIRDLSFMDFLLIVEVPTVSGAMALRSEEEECEDPGGELVVDVLPSSLETFRLFVSPLISVSLLFLSRLRCLCLLTTASFSKSRTIKQQLFFMVC